MTKKNAQFVLLAIEAWRRLHSLDGLLNDDDGARSYHALLYKQARHSPELDLHAFRDPGCRMIFGPQALVLLLPAVGTLRALGAREYEQELERLGLKTPDCYSAELEQGTAPKKNLICGSHPRSQMINCIRNAAAHHMESLLSEDDDEQGILMPEDGAYLKLVTRDLKLVFSGSGWQAGYIALLTDIIAATEKVVAPWITNEPDQPRS